VACELKDGAKRRRFAVARRAILDFTGRAKKTSSVRSIGKLWGPNAEALANYGLYRGIGGA
jgi:hypothetical protein